MQSLKSEVHIVGICGSLRMYSYNRGLLQEFKKQLPSNIKFTEANISELPFFTEEKEQSLPNTVVKLKQLIESADAIIISTPEYNLKKFTYI